MWVDIDTALICLGVLFILTMIGLAREIRREKIINEDVVYSMINGKWRRVEK